MSAPTLGPWAAFTDDAGSRPHTNIVGYRPRTNVVFSLPGRHKEEADVRLLCAAPDLLNLVEQSYSRLANIHSNWAGRDTHEGQALLCKLRDVICAVTQRDEREVQDEYTNRLDARGASQ